MKWNRRQITFFLTAIPAWFSFFICPASADTSWNAEAGYWADDANWTDLKPDGEDAYIYLRFSSTSVCTLDTFEGLFSSRLIMQNGQTLRIEEGGYVGAKWARLGRGSSSYVILSGSGTYVLNDDDLYCGLEGGHCEWRMFGNAALLLSEEDGDDGEEVYFGYNGGSALLQLNGSEVTVQVDQIHFSSRADMGTPSSTLEFVLDEGGAARIVSKRIYLGENGTSHLVITDPGVTLGAGDIVLLEAAESAGIGGKGMFDTLNGGPANEGTYITLGGNLYVLTYAYEASGDSIQNDIALVYQADPYALYKAHSPMPEDGSCVIDSPTVLKWTNPKPAGGVPTCTVYLGTVSDRAAMARVTLEPAASSVQLNAANFPTYGAQPLADGTTYYWIVDCAYADPALPPEAGQGDVWTFQTLLSLPKQDGFGGQAVGGAGGAVVTVSDFNTFKYFATSENPYIIRVSGTIDFGYGVKVQPKSNKTIEGADPRAVIIGNIDLSGSQNCNNVIIRNLNITNPYRDPVTDDGSDGITVWGATNVLITHCTIYDCGDGLCDITRSSDNVTVSWCKFYYTDPSDSHRFTMISGNDPSCRPHITLHHNWWAQNCDQRMPSGSWSTVHMYNNYFTCTGNYYCSNVRDGGEMLSESNYYLNVSNPVTVSLPPASGQPAGRIKTRDNAYVSCTGTIYPGRDTVFTPSYAYTIDAVADVPAIVSAGAGNRLYGDFNGDGRVDAEDLYLFSEFWLDDSNRAAFYQDLNGDGRVNFYEFVSFAGHWLQTY